MRVVGGLTTRSHDVGVVVVLFLWMMMLLPTPQHYAVVVAQTRLISYANESVISCDVTTTTITTSSSTNTNTTNTNTQQQLSIGITLVDLDVLYSNYDVFNDDPQDLQIRVTSTKERERVERIVGSSCDYLYNVEEELIAYETECSIAAASVSAAASASDNWFKEYHNLADIINWYQDLNSVNPTITTFVDSIGQQSIEGRNIPAFHITAATTATASSEGNSNRSSKKKKKKIWFQCQIHAREWISATTCMYVVNQLVVNYNNGDPTTINLLQQVEIIVIPIVNPDGYVYTWTTNRFWRKNRRKNRQKSYGVDLNRNYNDRWSLTIGSSTQPSSDIYKGTSPESEPEIAATTAYFKNNGPIYGAIDFHNYGQLILYPPGYNSNAMSPDRTKFVQLTTNMKTAIAQVNGRKYIRDQLAGFYPTSGSSVDWFYGDDVQQTNGGIRPYAIAIELPDKGKKGFQILPQDIIPIGEEIVPSIYIFIDTAITSPLCYNACPTTPLPSPSPTQSSTLAPTTTDPSPQSPTPLPVQSPIRSPTPSPTTEPTTAISSPSKLPTASPPMTSSPTVRPTMSQQQEPVFENLGTGYCRDATGNYNVANWKQKSSCDDLTQCENICKITDQCLGISWASTPLNSDDNCSANSLPRCIVYYGAEVAIEKSSEKNVQYVCYRYVKPAVVPTAVPTTTVPKNNTPTNAPTDAPTATPTATPTTTSPTTTKPTYIPTGVPSVVPSFGPSSKNPSSVVLSIVPAPVPSTIPSGVPSVVPSFSPSTDPSSVLSVIPTSSPSTAVPSFGATTILSVAPSSSPMSCVDTTGDVKLVEIGKKSCAKIRKKGYCKIKVKNEGGKKAKDFCPTACSVGDCVNCADETGRVKLVKKGKKTCAQIRTNKLCKEKVKVTGRPKAKTLCPTACRVDGCKLPSSESSLSRSRPSFNPLLV